MTSATNLRQAVELHLIPFVRPIGMSKMANRGPVRPGVVACTLGRALGDGRSSVLQVWCEVPELAAPVEVAMSTPKCQAAVLAGPHRWSHRLVSGEIDPTERPATIIVVSANLVVLDAGGRRVSFKFPVQDISKADAAHVSGWWTTPAGTQAATVLRIGDRTWHFEPSGKLLPTPVAAP
ncbi:hypothetical protein SAMN02745121_09090 [Nannocystis exedens]|uniref:Uncharacterized protein n=1 Tax=Nannocystis exedens TaxID=54 RepID=A0A1I2IYY0_9BACT|nr:hypothetical protein [Nannocystis exedens]PCC68462.1 hypothetical protein NAEX_01477 [Nannocystis exedens]SFF47389.1 hypothetical protein SAMN02745121_09090 [Nannocystis exedens]